MFDTLPMAARVMLPGAVKVTTPLTARLTTVLILPVPLPIGQLEPIEAAHDHVMFSNDAPKVSVTIAFDTALGPRLATTRV